MRDIDKDSNIEEMKRGKGTEMSCDEDSDFQT